MLRRLAFNRPAPLFIILGLLVLPGASPSTAEASQVVASPFVKNAPRIDGALDIREWRGSTVDLAGGSIRVANDGHRLYVLLNMSGDNIDDPAWASESGGDDFWITFDVDGDGEITPGLDVNFTTHDWSNTMRKRRYAGPGQWMTDFPSIPSSSWAPGFGCWFGDGSKGFSTTTGTTCAEHRIHEFGFDLREITTNASTVRIGVRAMSSTPSIDAATPDGFWNDFSNLIEVDLGPPDVPLIPPYPNASVKLAGHQFEVTQAVQSTDGSVPLVAGKTTVARVFAWTYGTSQPQNAVIYLYGMRDGDTLPGSPLAQMVTVDRTMPARDALNGTANFRLPTSWTEGEVVFRARARGLTGPNHYSDSRTMTFRHRTVPTIWNIPINTGSAGSPVTVSLNEMTSQESYAEAVLPLKGIRFIRKPHHVLAPMAPYYTDTAIKRLNKYYDQVMMTWVGSVAYSGRVPFALPHQIYGFSPTNDPNYGGLSDPIWGGGRGLVVTGYRGTSREGTMAHELMHNFDTSSAGTYGRHGPGCNAKGTDPEWPYANSDINEVGFDTRAPWNQTSSESTAMPATWKEIMTYCTSSGPTKWISPYRYDALFDRFVPSEAVAATSTPSRSSNMTYISGEVRSDGTASLDPVIVAPGFPFPAASGDHAVALLDASGQTLAERSIKIVFENAEGEQRDAASFSIQIPEVAGVKQIVVKHGTQVIASRQVSATPPTVTVTTPMNGASYPTGYVYVSWNGNDADGDQLRYAIHYSPDEGATWYPVASDLTETSYQMNTRMVPGGAKSRIRVMATDGYHTVSDDSSGTFFLERQPGSALISAPMGGEAFDEDGDVWLRGEGYDAAGTPIEDEQLFWEVNGEFVASGSEARITLPIGIHQIRLFAQDGPWYVRSEVTTVRVGGTCADRGDARSEDGPVSGPAHESEPLLGPLERDVHAISCDVLVKNGL